jgi:hypothetical protein
VLAGAVSGDPIYAEVKRAEGKCLVLSVNIDQGDLAFRTAFPIMVTNALSWYAGQSGELRPSFATGALAKVRVDEAHDAPATPIQLVSPAGDARTLAMPTTIPDQPSDSQAPQAETATESPLVTIPPLNACGIWRIVAANVDQKSGPPLVELAVNLANDSETDVRTPVELLEYKSQAVLAGWFASPIWFYLVGFAGLIAVIEWWLYQRRVIV